jgi:(p)ppGpp synthase/HD superfamily hydrolase
LSIEKALEVARKAHEGQKDKAGADYILHPLSVAGMLELEQEKIVALLHDVVEDSDMTLSDLLEMGFEEEIVKAVGLLTKDGTHYGEYLNRIKLNPLAREVKIADLRHNMDLSRIPDPTEKDLHRVEKYKNSLEFLQAE